MTDRTAELAKMRVLYEAARDRAMKAKAAITGIVKVKKVTMADRIDAAVGVTRSTGMTIDDIFPTHDRSTDIVIRPVMDY